MKEKNNSSLNSFDDSNFCSISHQKNSNLVPKLNLKQIEFNKIYNETNFQKSFSKISSTLTSKSVENRIKFIFTIIKIIEVFILQKYI